MKKIKVNDFSLKNSIESGQFFRYSYKDGYYFIILKDRILKIKQEADLLFYDSNNLNNLENIVINFFDLNTDYNIFNNFLIEKENNLKNILDKNKGYKILRMDPFETIISYIISANNSVLNIKNCVDRISLKYGKKQTYLGVDYYLFPNVEELKNVSLEDFKDMKLGFRSKYVHEIISKILNLEINIKSIHNMSTKDALEYLMKNNGIGLKVASCILLFSYQKYDVFPIDVWVKKYMEEEYNIKSIKEIKQISEKLFGKYSGIYIQYLFNAKRNK